MCPRAALTYPRASPNFCPLVTQLFESLIHTVRPPPPFQTSNSDLQGQRAEHAALVGPDRLLAVVDQLSQSCPWTESVDGKTMAEYLKGVSFWKLKVELKRRPSTSSYFAILLLLLMFTRRVGRVAAASVCERGWPLEQHCSSNSWLQIQTDRSDRTDVDVNAGASETNRPNDRPTPEPNSRLRPRAHRRHHLLLPSSPAPSLPPCRLSLCVGRAIASSLHRLGSFPGTYCPCRSATRSLMRWMR